MEGETLEEVYEVHELMKDCLSQPDMTAFADQNAPAAQLAAWKRHLRTCDHCATQVARLRAGMEPAVRQVEGSGIHVNTSVGMPLLSGLEPNLQLGDFLLERRLGAAEWALCIRPARYP